LGAGDGSAAGAGVYFATGRPTSQEKAKNMNVPFSFSNILLFEQEAQTPGFCVSRQRCQCRGAKLERLNRTGAEMPTKRQVVKAGLVIGGGTLFVLAFLSFFNHDLTPQGLQVFTFQAYYSHYAFPGSSVDVICVPRDHVSGEEPAWVLNLLEDVQVVDSKTEVLEWTTVTINVTPQQAEELVKAQNKGYLRALPHLKEEPREWWEKWGRFW
jgi:hypothetical protein